VSDFDLDQELIEEFVLESREGVDLVEVTLIDLERGRRDSGEADIEGVNAMFRAFHSIKGSAGFIGLERLVSVTHNAENLLDLVRNGKLGLDTTQVDAVCDALDYCRNALDALEQGKPEPGGHERVVQLVTAALTVSPEPEPEPEPEPVADEDPALAAFLDGLPPSEPEKSEAEAWEPEPAEPEEEPVVDPHGLLDAALEAAGMVGPEDEIGEDPGAEEIADDAPMEAVAKGRAKPEPKESAKAATKRRSAIRVDVEKLDALMNLVGELILAENGVAHHDAVAQLCENDGSVRRATVQLNRVARALQDIATSLRMVPIGGSFQRMQRLVRDLAQRSGKQIRLELDGTDTEVDKNLIEAIADPLVHIVRNAADHGLEGPEERVAAGKSPEGTIRLDARHAAGEVWISISDDGRGLNAAKIRARAVERGLIRADAELSDSELFPLIFEPGFSTAQTITDVSGRGVGMDVVQRNLRALDGRIDIQSELGKGTTFILRVPLTLAIIEGMLVRVADMRYTLPLLSIRESIVMQPGVVQTMPDGEEVARVRGQVLPVRRLVHLLDPGAAANPEGVLVVVEVEGRRTCLHVDSLVGQRQTVVKALPPYLAGHRYLSGCSILPSGEITLILDLGCFTERSSQKHLAA